MLTNDRNPTSSSLNITVIAKKLGDFMIGVSGFEKAYFITLRLKLELFEN